MSILAGQPPLLFQSAMQTSNIAPMRAKSYPSRSLLLLLFLFVFTTIVGAQECSKSVPCKLGCCSKYGFCGYGKDYCHKDVCVNNCDSLAQCDPGGFGKDFVEQSKCALNVCCSKYGFCGFTEDFCGDKKVKAPSCKSHSLSRVVGYYEGWAAHRPCNAFMPEQIPAGIYTHLNFAFASIDPKTFEVLPASQNDVKLYRRLTALKRIDPDLKVLIAIGGWTFNDPGPTATTFSDLARSETAQKAFIKSLIRFMSTYDFDGVDLDWEYPGAEDRAGRGEDFENFPKFLANLKSALKATGGRDEVTLTLPASFWYLQHFDIVKLEKHVNFFNIMSYDLHGTWDQKNKWVGPYLNAHTNLTEIKEAMNLLWRNNINPSKVVLGTGFYGRAFTASSSSCLSPGCTYISGAPAQPCSNEVSVMIQSEIVDVMKRTNKKPVLDKKAAVKILTFDNNQWVAFDDEDTLLMRADFAREQCLGGLMVWAVSQDVPDAKYSRAIGTVAGRKFTSIVNVGLALPKEKRTVKKQSQCKWTNCGENCPAGWTRMKRSDKESRKDEYMIDGTHCSWGYHALCCPPEGKLPTCGWYQHNNGKCKSECPSGTTEVGSLRKHCNNNQYQAACCTTGGDSMRLYDQCSWKEAPFCDRGKCSSSEEEVASSPTGSGGVVCNVAEWNYKTHALSSQERKYCCDQKKDEEKWADCEWYDNLGHGRDDEKYCRSGCPSDRVRVAKDSVWNTKVNGISTPGCTRGARAKCCIPQKSVQVKRQESADEIMQRALANFLNDPSCFSAWTSSLLLDTTRHSVGYGGQNSSAAESSQRDGEESQRVKSHMKRHGRLSHRHMHHASGSHVQTDSLGTTPNLKARQAFRSPDENYVRELVNNLVQGIATDQQRYIWNRVVPIKFKNLKWENVEDWMDDEDIYRRWGAYQLVENIVCAMGEINKLVGGQNSQCSCDTPACCPLGGTYCTADDAFEDDTLSRRDISLQAISGRRGYNITLPDGTIVTIQSESYYSSGDDFWHDTHRIRNSVYMLPDGMCNHPDPQIMRVSKPQQGQLPDGTLQVEHIIELNTLARFFTDAIAGVLPSGRDARTAALDPSVLRTLGYEYDNAPELGEMPGGGHSGRILERIFSAFGTRRNTQHFVLAQSGLNYAKTAFWQADVREDNLRHRLTNRAMRAALDNRNNLGPFVTALRDVVIAFNYLRDDSVWRHLLQINADIRTELMNLQMLHNGEVGNQRAHIRDAWDEWFRDFLRSMTRLTQAWVQRWTYEAINSYGGNNDEVLREFIRAVRMVQRMARDLELELDDLPPAP